MKKLFKLITALAFIFYLSGSALAGMVSYSVQFSNVPTDVTTETIAASGTSTSDAIDISKKDNLQWIFGLQITTTGTGTLKIELLVSNDGVTYADPEGFGDIDTTLAAGSSFHDFDPPAFKYFKFKFTEDGGANAVNITFCEVVIR